PPSLPSSPPSRRPSAARGDEYPHCQEKQSDAVTAQIRVEIAGTAPHRAGAAADGVRDEFPQHQQELTEHGERKGDRPVRHPFPGGRTPGGLLACGSARKSVV